MISLSTQRLRAAAVFALIFIGLASAAAAQTPYPNRTITLVLPFAAGSGTDTTTRIISQHLGAALGVGGHLTALRRTRVGRFGLDQARTLDELAERPTLSYSLDQACLQSFPCRDLTAEESEDTRHGRALKPAGIEGVYAAAAPDGQVMALLKDEGERTKSVVVLRPATL